MEYGIGWNLLGRSGFPLVPPSSCVAGSFAAALLALRAQVQSARALERRISAARALGYPWVNGELGNWMQLVGL